MREWCAANGWTIDGVFKDEAIEGSREDREQFQHMMALSRQEVRLVDGIALWSFSRFARDQLDSQFYKAELRTVDVVAPRRLASIYLLTGLLRCGVCADAGRGDVPMNGQHKSQFPTTRCYRCATKMHGRGADCDMPRIPTWRIEEAVIADFTQRVMTVEYVSAALQAAQSLAQVGDVDLDSRIASVERDVQEQKERLSRLLNVIEKKGMNELIEQQYDHAQQRYADLTQQLAVLRGRQLGRGQKPLPQQQIEQFVGANRTLLLEGPTKERRELLKHFIKRVVMYPDRAVIEYNFRIEGEGVDDVFTHFLSEENGGLCWVPPREFAPKTCGNIF